MGRELKRPPTGTTKMIENNTSDRRFAVARLIDLVDSSLKSNS
jgi:hypothetical protein